MFKLKLSALLLCLAWQAVVQGEPLTIILQPGEPFVYGQAQQVSGPYPEAFASLLHEQGMAVQFNILPPRRALHSFRASPASCLLAVHYSPDLTEEALYLGKVAPLVLWAYSLKSDEWPMNNLTQLKKRSIAGSEIPELREMTDREGLSYRRLPEANSGYEMLQHRRFQILLGDVGIQLRAKHDNLELKQLKLPVSADRWLVCHRDLPREQLRRLKAAIKQGLFAPSVQEIWQRHGLGAYYLEVRREWLKADSP